MAAQRGRGRGRGGGGIINHMAQRSGVALDREERSKLQQDICALQAPTGLFPAVANMQKPLEMSMDDAQLLQRARRLQQRAEQSGYYVKTYRGALGAEDLEGYSEGSYQLHPRIPLPKSFFPPELRAVSSITSVDAYGACFEDADVEDVEDEEEASGSDVDEMAEAPPEEDDFDDYGNDYGAFEDGDEGDKAFGDDEERGGFM